MFGWIKKIFSPKKVDWEGINHQDELNDSFYMDGFTGTRGDAMFENAKTSIKFFYGNGKAPTYRSIRGRKTMFKSGKVVAGTFFCHSWDGGEFCGDTLRCHEFNGGIFRGKHLICDLFSGGSCETGTVECGVWNDGVFTGDVLVVKNWMDGAFNGGTFHGKWRGGVWSGKKFCGINLSGKEIKSV